MHTRKTSVTITVIIAFWTRKGHVKHGYCSSNHTYDHLVIRNTWLRKTYKAQNTTAFSFSMHKGGPCSNSSCVPTSSSQRNKEIRRNARAGQRTQSSTQGIWGTGSTFSWFQEVLWLLFDTSPGEPTTMKRGKKSCDSSWETEKNDHKEREEGLLLSQGAEKRLAKPNTQSSPAASNSPLAAEARAEAPMPLLERWGKAVGRAGRNLSYLSLFHPHLGQILARSREWEGRMNMSPSATMLLKPPAFFPLCFGQPEVVKIN